MKQRKIRACVMALAMAACLTPIAPAIAAQNQGSSAQQPAEQKKPQAKTYYGKIVKLQNGDFALMIGNKGSQGYYLDDQKAAAKYADKDVLVTGTVDPKTSMLHVVEIKPAF